MLRCRPTATTAFHLVLTCLFVACSSFTYLRAQTTPVISGERVKRAKAPSRYAIHDIVFDVRPDSSTGSLPSQTELLSIINSRACDFSITSRVLRSLTYESMAYDEVPSGVVTTLKEFYTRASMTELRYFDNTIATLDVYRLRDYFEQIGYHDSQIRFVFQVSHDQRDNTLRFIISPRRLYRLDTIVVAGIDTIPVETRQGVQQLAHDARTLIFNEPMISALTAQMLNYLHNSGYAFARLPVLADSAVLQKEAEEKKRRLLENPGDTADGSAMESRALREQTPLAMIDTVRKRDSVTIFLQPLKRYYFGSTKYIDSTMGMPFVVTSLKEQQLEFRPGDLYNLSALRRSQATISSLGPFERVSIDTTAVGDSILTTVFCTYKRVWEIGANLFLNNTFPDAFTNLGIEANYLHRNLLHDANAIAINGRYTLRNPFPWLSKDNSSNTDQEVELAGSYAQPGVFPVWRKRVDLNLSLNYSNRYIVDPLSVKSVTGRMSFLMQMAENTERVQLDFILEAQSPKGYNGAFDAAYKQVLLSNPLVDTARLRKDLTERLDPYNKLNSYAENGNKFPLTLMAIAGNYFTDKRNDLFYPSYGHTGNILVETTITAEGLNNLTNFTRFLGYYYLYGTVGSNWTSAFKVRGGHVIWRGFEAADSTGRRSNPYIVPSDRGFFAGGASSIRSFGSRQLGNPASDDAQLPSNVGDLANYVGWATVVEFSAELRYTFPNYPDIGEFLADKIKRLGITFFVDAGNAFNRLTPSAYGKASYSDVLNPTNWAVAVGSGIRFATPAGPIRLDFGIDLYNPTLASSEYRWIWTRNFYKSITAQISLGHAF